MSETTEFPQPEAGNAGSEDFSEQTLDQPVQQELGDVGTDNNAASPDSDDDPIPVRERNNYRKIQREYDQLINRLGPLKGYLESFSGTDLLTALRQYNDVRGDPTLSQLIDQKLTTGRVEMPTAETQQEDDPYVDESTAKLMQQVDALKHELVNVRGEIQGMHQGQGLQKISNYTEKFLGEYPLTEDQREVFQRGMDQKFEILGSTADGIRQLKDMTWDTYMMLGVSVIEPMRGEIESRRLQANSRQRQTHATDAPSGVGTHGVQAPAGLPQPKNMADLMKQAKATMREAVQRSRSA